MKSFVVLAAVALSLCGSFAFAYPVIDHAVSVGGLPIAAYPDSHNAGVYWYIPQSIEPWKRDGRYRSSLFDNGGTLSFVFRGQASVDTNILDKVALSLRTSTAHLMPIAYDSSQNFVCQNVFMDEDRVSWQFPQMIGNYLEVVPVSIRTRNRDVIPELRYHLSQGGGLACTVEVAFKGVSSAYRLRLEADFEQIYNRFEAAAHAQGLWWEVDIHSLVERLRRSGAIRITSLEDASLPASELDKKIQSAMDEIIKHITANLFEPALKLPQGDIAGRGAAWSLRADVRHSGERRHYEAILDSRKVNTKRTQISVRLAVD